MMRKSNLYSIVVAAAAVAAVGVAAASEPVGKIARVQGAAVVSQGAQYVVVREGMALREGDRLMALEGGSLTIQFADGCQLALSDSQVFTVGAVSSCAAEAVGQYAADPSTGVAQAPNAQGYLRPAALEAGGVTGMIGGGAVVAVAAAVIAIAAIADSERSTSKKTSISP